MKPVQGRVYTFAEVCKLDLLDSPSMCMFIDLDHPTHGEIRVDTCIQTSHLTEEEHLQVPGMAESKWRYIRTTSEWIPIFNFAGTNPESLVDIQLDTDFDREYDPHKVRLWCTPKGHKRVQYYETVRDNGDLFILDKFYNTRRHATHDFAEMFDFVEKTFGVY